MKKIMIILMLFPLLNIKSQNIKSEITTEIDDFSYDMKKYGMLIETYSFNGFNYMISQQGEQYLGVNEVSNDYKFYLRKYNKNMSFESEIYVPIENKNSIIIYSGWFEDNFFYIKRVKKANKTLQYIAVKINLNSMKVKDEVVIMSENYTSVVKYNTVNTVYFTKEKSQNKLIMNHIAYNNSMKLKKHECTLLNSNFKVINEIDKEELLNISKEKNIRIIGQYFDEGGNFYFFTKNKKTKQITLNHKPINSKITNKINLAFESNESNVLITAKEYGGKIIISSFYGLEDDEVNRLYIGEYDKNKKVINKYFNSEVPENIIKDNLSEKRIERLNKKIKKNKNNEFRGFSLKEIAIQNENSKTYVFQYNYYSRYGGLLILSINDNLDKINWGRRIDKYITNYFYASYMSVFNENKLHFIFNGFPNPPKLFNLETYHKQGALFHASIDSEGVLKKEIIFENNKTNNIVFFPSLKLNNEPEKKIFLLGDYSPGYKKVKTIKKLTIEY